MLAQTPVDTVRAFYEVADARPFDDKKLLSFFAQKFEDHDPQPGAHESSGQGVVALFASLQAASKDAVHDITYIEPVGNDKALVRWKFKGTHTGDLFGTPASGKTFDIAGMELWEFDQDGKIKGLWHVEALQKLFAQVSTQ